MSKKNDDSIERFFRKAAAQHDGSNMERDWQKMEKLLDAEANKVAAKKFQKVKRGFLTGAVLTGIVAIVYFLISTEQRPESRLLTDGSLVQKQAVASEEAPTSEQKEDQATATLFPESNTQQKGHINVSPSNTVIATPFKGLQPRQKNLTIHEQPPFISADKQKEQTDFIYDDVAANEKEVSSEETGDTKKSIAASSIVEEEKTVADDEKKSQTLQPVEKMEISSTEEEEEQEDLKQPFGRWNVALSIAPDFSTTAMNGYTAPGGAFGISVGFNLFRKLSITSGIIKTSKKYVGYGSEYQPPEGYWKYRTNGVVPDEITGNCAVVEIPLTIQYDVKQTTRNRIFIAAGISSYRMLSEAYHYEFEQPNPGASDSWSSSEPSSYLFSVGHISAGYERMITPRIALGVEPFLKVPFAGIGWTDIKLFTTGAYFNLRYRFGKKFSLESVRKN